jgi:hypothetical protein
MALSNSINRRTLTVLAAIASAVSLAPHARADDCAPIRSGMMKSAQTPHVVTVTRIKDGKTVTNRAIQTKDTRYIDVNGKWRSMPFTPNDVKQMEETLNASQLTCSRVGTDNSDGKAATVYAVRMKDKEDGTESDIKVWLGTNGLPVKAEHPGADGYTTSYDFERVAAPAESTPFRVNLP